MPRINRLPTHWATDGSKEEYALFAQVRDPAEKLVGRADIERALCRPPLSIKRGKVFREEPADTETVLLTFSSPTACRKAARALRAQAATEEVYVPGPLVPCSDPEEEPDFAAGGQKPLEEMGVPDMWDMAGGQGQNVRLADIEIGWYTNHPELNGLGISQVSGTRMGNPDFWSHGTKTMTTVAARANKKKMAGVLPALGSLVMGTPFLEGASGITQATPAAIRAAAGDLGPGDVMLFEVAVGGVGPLEYEGIPVGHAVEDAIAKGVVVVCAAGNDYLTLTQTTNAICVGAASHRPEGGAGLGVKSNRGKPIDVCAWGDGVRCGYVGPSGAGMSEFQDTSAAAALVAGIVAGVQSCRLQAGLVPLDQAQFRTLLRNPDLMAFDPNASIGLLPHAGKLARAAMEV